MSKHTILDDSPEVVRYKVERALRNITRLTDGRFDEEVGATMAPSKEKLDELRRIGARKGSNADAVIVLLSQDH